MNLLKNKVLLRNLLKQGDYWNTMKGGISMTRVKTFKTDDVYVIELSAPSVSSDAFNIVLNYNQLIVYSILKGIDQNHQAVIPMFNQGFELPVDADLEGIDAVHEEGTLRILIPFKADKDQFKRKIDIKNIK